VGISIRLAPGVRVRASSRGIRTSLGPRAARVHVGSGRTGVSTGAGPVTLYGSLGGGGTRRSGGRGQSAAQPQPRPSPAADRKAQDAADLAIHIEGLLKLHRRRFAPASKPQLRQPERPDEEALRLKFLEQEIAGVGRFRVKARAAAKERAVVLAAEAAERQYRLSLDWVSARQRELDRMWELLLGNDEQTVMSTLEEAFDDNDLAAAPLGVSGDHVYLAMVAAGVEDVPDRWPGTTAAGNPSIRKITRQQQDMLITAVTLGNVLLTVQEAFAVCPGVNTATVVVLRETADAPPDPGVEAVLVGRWQRGELTRWWDPDEDAISAASRTADDLIVGEAGTGGLKPIDVFDHPELADLLAAVDRQP